MTHRSHSQPNLDKQNNIPSNLIYSSPRDSSSGLHQVIKLQNVTLAPLDCSNLHLNAVGPILLDQNHIHVSLQNSCGIT